MSLTADSCGGFNPLVSLAEHYTATSRYASPSVSNHGSHSISALLNTVICDPNILDPNSVHKDRKSAVDLSNTSETREAFKRHESSKSYTSKVPHWRPVLQRPPQASLQRPPQASLQRPLQASLQRPPQASLQRPLNTSSQLCNYTQLHNHGFELWVRRFRPEILQMKCSDVIDTSLSHDLAEEWLKDFNLDQVLDVKSLTEAERIVEDWIKEFTLGQQFNNQLTFNDKILLEEGQTDKAYEHVTHGTQEHVITPRDQNVERGIEMIKLGDLMSAISIFEELVRQDVSNGEAWYYLGICHQQSENEEPAIRAFKNVSESDMCYKSSLLALAASFLNENKHNSATLCLLNWLKLAHPQHASDKGLEVTNAAVLRHTFQQIPRDESNNVEIQTCLGILSCILGEHGAAVQHFQDAVAVSPQDFMLWNRIGATLANANRSTESIEAYRRALTLCPGYTRARYNLGIACLNLGAHREGIEHFLMCLQQQPQSDSVWAILRLALCIEKHYDLLESVDMRDIATLSQHFA